MVARAKASSCVYGTGLGDTAPWRTGCLGGRYAADVLGFVLHDIEVSGTELGVAGHANVAGGGGGVVQLGV